MDLYKIISQLTENEFQEIYSNFTANKADKSASFLKIIRDNPESPDKDFLKAFDISPSAFYVLKSRLNQKVEAFLLNRVGDPNLHIINRVLNAHDLVFNNPREISVAALRKLEKELLRFDFPYGLMIVYKELQNLHAFDDDSYTFYKSRYNQQVAYALAMDKAADMVVQFFRAYDNYYLGRKDRDFSEMIRIMEKIENLNNLYDSHRLTIFKSIIHIFAQLYLTIPDDIRCEVEPVETLLNQASDTLDDYKGEPFYKNLELLFNFLLFVYHDQQQDDIRSSAYYGVCNNNIEDLILGHHFNAATSLFLFHKLALHQRQQSQKELLEELETDYSQIDLEPYRTSLYVNFHLFQATAYFYNRQYKHSSRILYNLRNEINLRKHIHASLEVKFFLALSYVMVEDFDLANQLILSLQRQLRKPTMAKYEHAKTLLKVLSVALGGKPKTRRKNLETYIERWNEVNTGRYALLTQIDLAEVFLKEEASEHQLQESSEKVF